LSKPCCWASYWAWSCCSSACNIWHQCSNNVELRNVKDKEWWMKLRILTSSAAITVGRWLMGTLELVLAACKKSRGGVQPVSRMSSPM
jgi:hypothetical protein